jgi:hypothetical protein
MNSHSVLRRLLRLGVLRGLVGMALLGGVGSPRFGRMRVTPWNGWMCHLSSGDGGRPSQRDEKHQQLTDHVIIFGRESAGL